MRDKSHKKVPQSHPLPSLSFSHFARPPPPPPPPVGGGVPQEVVLPARFGEGGRQRDRQLLGLPASATQVSSSVGAAQVGMGGGGEGDGGGGRGCLLICMLITVNPGRNLSFPEVYHSLILF